MASTPLSTIYLQIEYSHSPFATLGISHQATLSEAREQYHALALRIHPDKARTDDLLELYTTLFKKLRTAYDQLLTGHFTEDDKVTGTQPLRLPETAASLHARNVAFREALRAEREKALKAKHEADTYDAAKRAAAQAKNERLQELREARAQLIVLTAPKKGSDEDRRRRKAMSSEECRVEAIAVQSKTCAESSQSRRSKGREAEETPANSKDGSRTHRHDAGVCLETAGVPDSGLERDEQADATQMSSAEFAELFDGTQNWLATSKEETFEQLEDWEQLEDSFAAQDEKRNATVETEENNQKAAWKAAKNIIKSKGVLQDKPTGPPTPMWDGELDERLASKAEIQDRWDKNLLSGGRGGSVSLSLKKQRENNGAARLQKACLALCEEADRLIKPMLTGSKDHTFSGLEQDALEEQAFVETERKAVARTDRMLMLMMDEDIREQYLLQEGEVEEMLGGGKFGLLEYVI